MNSYGNKFETQRVLEKKSLEHTLEKFRNFLKNVRYLFTLFQT